MFPLSTLLSRLIRVGTLTVIDAEGRTHTFGGSAPGPSVTMKLGDARLYRSLFFNPELAAGEAYMDGTLTFPGSVAPRFPGARFRQPEPPVAHAYPPATGPGSASRRLKRFQQSNPVGKAQQNIAHHYDLGNEFYGSSSTTACTTRAPISSTTTTRSKPRSATNAG